jgi:phosphopantetheinyl transferase (holo-ACP synthase)
MEQEVPRQDIYGKEILYAYKKKDPYLSLSVRFAAKRPLLKLLAVRFGILKDIEILNHEGGRPFINNSRLRIFVIQSGAI